MATGPANRVRIIGGRWRGRRIGFPDIPGLRPSPDRVRETLFNWLAPVLPGADCLDLFAGSGALGLEAASRGAGRVVLLDADQRVAVALQEQVRALAAEALVEVVRADVLTWLRRASQPFDIVFLDPPFHQGLVGPCLKALAAGDWLAPGGYVYVEAEREMDAERLHTLLPAGWSVYRSKQAGEVGYHLLQAGAGVP